MDLGAMMRSQEGEVLIGVRVVSEQHDSNGSFTHLAWYEHKLRLVLISSVNCRFRQAKMREVGIGRLLVLL
jgi:hypothetical protein